MQSVQFTDLLITKDQISLHTQSDCVHVNTEKHVAIFENYVYTAVCMFLFSKSQSLWNLSMCTTLISTSLTGYRHQYFQYLHSYLHLKLSGKQKTTTGLTRGMKRTRKKKCGFCLPHFWRHKQKKNSCKWKIIGAIVPLGTSFLQH